LRAGSIGGVKTKWNAAPDAIRADAEWFFPYLGRFIWGVTSSADSYLVEGVDFLPEHVARISARYPVRAVFLGCSTMTLGTLDQFPGRSSGYAGLPDEMRRQIAQDVPLWSEFIRQECERFGYPYIDMTGDFNERIDQAKAALTTGI